MFANRFPEEPSVRRAGAELVKRELRHLVAGADPGPVCYGQGAEPTVTDAHVFLGHIAAEGFLDGELPLDVDAVARAFERLARRLGVKPAAAAQGVLDVARAAIRRAVGVMTMQRGHDPAQLPLVAFGGAGGLAAAAVAESLRMPGTLVPAHPGVLDEPVTVPDGRDDLVEGVHAGHPGGQRDPRSGEEHLQAVLPAHPAHVGDEVLRSEVAPPHLGVTQDGREGREVGILDPDGNLVVIYFITSYPGQ